MDRDYGAQYKDLYQRHWWWRAREQFLLSVIRQHRPRQGGTVLDIGCGDGVFFSRLSEFGRVEGIEADGSLVTPQGRREGKIYVAPFDRNFQPGKQYSLILMLDVLEHLECPVSALRYAVELLEPSGLLVATVPACPVLWTTHDDLNLHYTRYTLKTFQALAKAAALRIDSLRYFYHWLFPLKLMARAKERLTHSRPAPPRVPPALLNRFFYGVSRLEQVALGRAALPFGSSLLAVGGKQDPSKARSSES